MHLSSPLRWGFSPLAAVCGGLAMGYPPFRHSIPRASAAAPDVAPPPRGWRAARLRWPTACRWPGGDTLRSAASRPCIFATASADPGRSLSMRSRTTLSWSPVYDFLPLPAFAAIATSPPWQPAGTTRCHATPATSTEEVRIPGTYHFLLSWLDDWSGSRLEYGDLGILTGGAHAAARPASVRARNGQTTSTVRHTVDVQDSRSIRYLRR